MAAVEPVRPRGESFTGVRETPRPHAGSHAGWHAAAVTVTALAGMVLGVSVADSGNAVLRLVLALSALILLVRQVRAR